MGKQGSCISQLRLQWQNSTDWVVKWAYQVVLVVKNLPANARDIRDARWIPGSTRSPGGGHGNPLQYSYLEKPMDRGAWQPIVHRVLKSATQLKWLSTCKQWYLTPCFPRVFAHRIPCHVYRLQFIVHFHSNYKEKQCKRMLKLPHNCTHLTG